MKNTAVLFTNNLRVEDNMVLYSAIENGENVFPIYYFDKKYKTSTELGMRKIGRYRAKFMIESVENLQENLGQLGSDLFILKSDSINIITDFCIKNNIQKLFMQEPVGYYEIQEAEDIRLSLNEKNIEFEMIWDHTLVDIGDLPFPIDDLPDVFTEFRKQVEKKSEILDTIDKPEKIVTPKIEHTDKLTFNDFGYEIFQGDKRSVLDFKGGEDAAWARLNHYFWETEQLKTYKETRNGLIGPDYSSKMSTWLAFGCISARSIYWEVERFEQEVQKNSSTYWLVFELLWRDFYQYVLAQNSKRFFKKFPSEDSIFKNQSEEKNFDKWVHGNTGEEFVDANMIELKNTGFMSNRGRQIVASYLINDLHVDWRVGAQYFEEYLIDYDVASNWGNWAYQAGVGNDPRGKRYFNIKKQQQSYDPKNEYTKLWISSK